jgi:hypothetical protein
VRSRDLPGSPAPFGEPLCFGDLHL